MLQPRLRNRLKYRISVSLPSQIRYTTGLRFLAWTDLRLISFILPIDLIIVVDDLPFGIADFLTADI